MNNYVFLPLFIPHLSCFICSNPDSSKCFLFLIKFKALVNSEKSNSLIPKIGYFSKKWNYIIFSDISNKSLTI